jgi:hypothetical protein
MSPWQTPHASTFTRTIPAPGSDPALDQLEGPFARDLDGSHLRHGLTPRRRRGIGDEARQRIVPPR